ncbi:MAG: S46 family peptidase [Bacteroidales bacterium]
MKRLLTLLFVALLMSSNSYAVKPPDEGMWLPMFVERLNYVDMQEEGLQLTPEELYSINNSSLKDAIVGLSSGSAPEGFFCTAEVVSDKGLLLTNHHCAYSKIQEHSSVENDYLTDGFWAKSLKEDLKNENLTASFLVRMDDVTEEVMDEIEPDMSESERASAIKKVSEKLKKENSEKGKYDVTVKSFFSGNEFYMFVYETYKDVRLVGAPPTGVGKFGGDTDNWMWPRHTGDFAMFRVYTAPDGSPAEYSEENVPMKPKHHLPISIKGVEEGDFAMIWGYPGGTQRYLTSWGVDDALEKTSPTVVKVRDRKLEIMRKAMNEDKEIDIMYAAKYATIANGWKYFRGQMKGIKDLNVYDKKKKLEKEFTNWVNEKESRKEKYGEALDLIEEGYKMKDTILVPQKYYEEALLQGGNFLMNSFQYFGLYSRLERYHEQDKIGWKIWKVFEKSSKDTSVINPMAQDLKASLDDQFEDYSKEVDHKVFAALLELFYENVDQQYHPDILSKIEEEYDGDIKAYADHIYKNSLFVEKERLTDFLDNPEFDAIEDDPGLMFAESVIKEFRNFLGTVQKANSKIDHGKRLFVAGLREMNPDKKYYPNANSTMRVTYGTVESYFPEDAVHYDYYTTLEGVVEKYDPKEKEFNAPDKLLELYENKDYGRYAREDGTMPVAFISDNDITGGNSGSPVLNGKGHLIGTAFDGNWEAMSGDIAFEPKVQRTINVDARYILFIIEKLGGADNLIKEMTIIE